MRLGTPAGFILIPLIVPGGHSLTAHLANGESDRAKSYRWRLPAAQGPVGKPRVGALRDQRFVALACVAVLEGMELARTVRHDDCAFVVRHRAHGAAAVATGEMRRVGRPDRHDATLSNLHCVAQVV